MEIRSHDGGVGAAAGWSETDPEAKYRSLFNSIDQAFCIIQMVLDADGRAVDFRFLEINPAFEKHTGIMYPVGKTICEVEPGYDPRRITIYERIAATGEAQRFENVPSLGRYFDAYAFRIGMPEDRCVAILFNDVTERKRREENAVFLAEVAEQFSRPSSADEIIQKVGARLGAFLNLATCHFVEIDEAADRSTVTEVWRVAEAQELAGVYRISDFLTPSAHDILRSGETLVVNDTLDDPHTDPTAYAGTGVRAFISVPFFRGAEWKYLLSATTAQTRPWRKDEIELVRELANRVFPRLERARAEEALRRREGQYSLLVESLPDVVFQLDRHLRHLYISPAITAITAQPPEEWLGRTGREMGLPTDACDRFEAACFTTFTTGKETQMEFSNRGREYRTRILPEKDSGGQVQMVMGITEDITERKRAEEVARQSKERQGFLLRFSDALRPLADPVAVQEKAVRLVGKFMRASRVGYAEDCGDGETVQVTRDYTRGVASVVGSYRYADYGAERLTDLRAGRTYVNPDVANDPSLPDEVRRAYAALEIGAAAQVPLVKAGQLVATFFLHYTHRYDFSSDEIGLLIEVAERTWAAVERARATEALRESEERMRVALDAANLGTWEWNRQTGAVLWNDRHFDLFGLPPRPGPLVPDDFFRHLHPEDRAWVAERLQKAAAERTVFAAEYRILRDDGAERWMSGYGRLIGEATGKPERMVGVMFDITEQRLQRNAIEDLNIRLRRAISESHHRIKNNLQLLSVLVELQRMEQPETSERSVVAGLERLGNHINALASLHDLLTMELQASTSDLDTLSLRGALERLLPLLQTASGGRKIDLLTEDIRIPLKQGTNIILLINELVANAIKHGEGDIGIRLRYLDETPATGSPLALLEVTDQGPGFPPDFNPILSGNTGVNLIQSIATWDLQGHIRYETRPEGGARVAVTFPVRPTLPRIPDNSLPMESMR